MSKFDFSEIKDYNALKYLRWLGIIVRDVTFKVKYIGIENVPEGGGFIIASNHVHALDPLVIQLALKKQNIHFMAKKEVFDVPVFRWFIKHLNGFPVVRGSVDSNAINFAEKIPQSGRILGIFPEGTRSKDGKPHRAKKGVTVVAAKAKCDIIPVSVYNDKGFKWRSKTTVRFGPAIHYEELGLSDEPTRDELSNATELIMNRINAQWEEGH